MTLTISVTVHQSPSSSSTMATTDSRNNQHPYFPVRDLAVKLLRHPTLYLNSDDLATNGIEVAAMDIRTGTPADSGPQFGHLYPSKEFNAMFKMIDEWPQQRGGFVYESLQIQQLFESSFLGGGLAGQSKYVWSR
jgi:hypothetical protein